MNEEISLYVQLGMYGEKNRNGVMCKGALSMDASEQYPFFEQWRRSIYVMKVKHDSYISTWPNHIMPRASEAMSIRPTSNDVLLGRGGNNFKHEGNEQLKNFALLRVREYGAATKTEKGNISRYENEMEVKKSYDLI